MRPINENEKCAKLYIRKFMTLHVDSACYTLRSDKHNKYVQEVEELFRF